MRHASWFTNLGLGLSVGIGPAGNYVLWPGGANVQWPDGTYVTWP